MPGGVAVGFSAAVVGAAGIGSAHARELSAAGCDDLLVVGRNFDSAKATAERLSGQLRRRVQAVEGLSELAERRVDFISICSPTELHVAHCRQLQATGAFLLVEKPFFWVESANRSIIQETTDDLFEASNGRLAVNHPTGLLVQSFARVAGPLPRMREFTFSYRTRGRYQGKMIAVDLLPHALSALLTLAALSESAVASPVQIAAKQEDMAWHFEFTAGDTKCRFEFNQDPAQRESKLSFSFNGLRVDREQEALGDNFRVFLAFSGTRVEVPNPMTTSVQRALSAARAKTPIAGEAAYVGWIMTAMAALLSS